MKNLLLCILVIFGITSCSKDSLDQNPDLFIQPDLSEIKVSISYLQWTGQGEGCSGSASESLSYIKNAKVELYAGEQNVSDALPAPIRVEKTNAEGIVLLENIEPATYTVWVDTPHGQKSRTITTQLHKRHYIDFSF